MQPPVVFLPPMPPRRKFQHRYRTHIILFLLTLITTTIVGADNYAGAQGGEGFGSLAYWARGLWYSIPALVILSCHEFGHYIFCRIYNVDATLPYYLPAPPFFLSGTFGAVIRIREPFPSKRALFDIGIAGPIGGFLALVPLLYLGVAMSHLATFPPNTDLIEFGEPLLIKAMIWLKFGARPAGMDVVLHPLGFAAWLGMLVTALNLLPFGQLDGGHIMYAVLGKRAARVSIATIGVTALLTLHSASWLVTTLMLLAMAYFLGFRHPRIIDEDAPLDNRRKLLALFALFMFIVCFTPVPIDMVIAK